MSPSEMSLTASRISSFTLDKLSSLTAAGVGDEDLKPFLSGVLCLIWLPLLRGLCDLLRGDRDLRGDLDLLGDLDLRDPLNDLDLSLVRYLGEGDRDPLLFGDDRGDGGLLDPDEFSEVLS